MTILQSEAPDVLSARWRALPPDDQREAARIVMLYARRLATATTPFTATLPPDRYSELNDLCGALLRQRFNHAGSVARAPEVFRAAVYWLHRPRNGTRHRLHWITDGAAVVPEPQNCRRRPLSFSSAPTVGRPLCGGDLRALVLDALLFLCGLSVAYRASVPVLCMEPHLFSRARDHLKRHMTRGVLCAVVLSLAVSGAVDGYCYPRVGSSYSPPTGWASLAYATASDIPGLFSVAAGADLMSLITSLDQPPVPFPSFSQ